MILMPAWNHTFVSFANWESALSTTYDPNDHVAGFPSLSRVRSYS